jgi:hypothetical protein
VMEARLDVLLELAREPHTSDEPFVGRVMALVVADAAARKRSFIRPAAAIAASVVVLAGAMVALFRSTAPAPDVALHATHGATATARPLSTDGRAARSPAPTGGATQHAAIPKSGYTSPTSSYAVDHETGLRLQTEIYRTEFPPDVPQRVTLTLENTGRRPVSISAQHGCALRVAAYPTEAEGADGQSWNCATSSSDARAAGAETFVLEPGEKLAADATIVLGASGDWSLVGKCRCAYEQENPSSVVPDGNPLGDLSRFGADLPSYPAPTTDEGAEGLVTPPIRVTAT